MICKLLILRSEKIFFPQGPHIYWYLAEQFGKLEEFKKLDEKYQTGKIKGPLLLKETVETVLKGEKIGKVVEASISYVKKFLNPDLKNFLKKVKSKNYEIASFCSYPRIFFMETNQWPISGVNYIYGVVNNLDKEMRITGIKPLEFQDEEFVKREMEKIGFKGKFTTEPNRYGMLGALINLMKEENFIKENIVLIGDSITAEPQMKLAGKVISKFDDLTQVLKEL